jgi:hypothetical protein
MSSLKTEIPNVMHRKGGKTVIVPLAPRTARIV